MPFNVNGQNLPDIQVKYYNSTSIVRRGMMVYLDAQISDSYPGEGSTWYDLSGNGYDFTLTNSPVFGQYNRANAFQFSGSNDYATRAGSISQDIGSAGTVVIMMSSINNSNFGSCSRLVSFNDGQAVNNDYSTYFTLASCDESRYGLWWRSSYGGVGGLYPTTSLKAANDPYRIVSYKWTQNSNAYVHVNGVQEASSAIGSGFNYADIGRMTIGMNSALTLENAYVRVAAVAIYSVELTNTEVLQNYQYFRTRFEKYYDCGYGCTLYNYDPGCTDCYESKAYSISAGYDPPNYCSGLSGPYPTTVYGNALNIQYVERFYTDAALTTPFNGQGKYYGESGGYAGTTWQISSDGYVIGSYAC